MRAYLDTCVVVYLIEGSPDVQARVLAFLDAHESTTPCTSGLVLLECLVGAFKRSDSGLAARFRRYCSSMESLPITDEICERAAKNRADTKLALPDALHLAIAEAHGCDEFWTSDAHFQALDISLPLRIVMVG